jgi:hypothetical protein
MRRYRLGYEEVVASEDDRDTHLDAFLKFCAASERDNDEDTAWQELTLPTFPRKYVWNHRDRVWTRRSGDQIALGRMYSIHPSQGDVFYLRLLLLNLTGQQVRETLLEANGAPRCCICLEARTNNVILRPCNHSSICQGCAPNWLREHPTCPLCRAAVHSTERTFLRVDCNVHKLRHGHETFKAACKTRELLADDGEWAAALEEAIETGMPEALRALMLHILCYCAPSEPVQLFENFCVRLGDDFRKQLDERQAGLGTDANVRICVLYALRSSLDGETSSVEKDALANLPVLSASEQAFIDAHDRIKKIPLQHAYDYDVGEQEFLFQSLYANCSRVVAQKVLIDAILNTILAGHQVLTYVNAPGGCGKTYTFNCIMAALRAHNLVVLAVATTGIAALQLNGGKTVHTALKVPIDPTGSRRGRFALPIDSNSLLGKLICMDLVLLVWDEAPMANKDLLESIDYNFRQLRGSAAPFGGVSVLLGGDFRQCLPVIRGGSRAEQVSASILCSPLFVNHFSHCALVDNIRVQNCIDTAPERSRLLKRWAEQLLQVGDGQCRLSEDDAEDSFLADMPDLVRLQAVEGKDDVRNMIHQTFGDLEEVSALPIDELVTNAAMHAAILCPQHVSVNYINDCCLEDWCGDMVEKRAFDYYLDDTDSGAVMMQTEHLNAMNPTGTPPFVLKLKVGMPLVVLRNMTDGLMNGTRLILLAINKHTLLCKVLTGRQAGREVMLCRFMFKHEGPDQPLAWGRRQFPVKPCWAMTINKSQGTTLESVAVCLIQCASDGEDVAVAAADAFSHGQLYVALSRCGDCTRVCVYTTRENADAQRLVNVVYPEALNPIDPSHIPVSNAHPRVELADVVEDDIVYDARAHLTAEQELDVPWHGYVFEEVEVDWNGGVGTAEEICANCADIESEARFEDLMNGLIADDDQ